MLAWPFLAKGKGGTKEDRGCKGECLGPPRVKDKPELLNSRVKEQENLDVTKRVPRTAHDLSASSRGRASRVRTRLRTRGFQTPKPLDGKHSWGTPKIPRLDNLPGHIGASSPSTQAWQGSDSPQRSTLTPGATVPTRGSCPSRGGERLCRIRSAGAGIQARALVG